MKQQDLKKYLLQLQFTLKYFTRKGLYNSSIIIRYSSVIIFFLLQK